MMRLSSFILKNLDTILQEWTKFASTLIPAGKKADQNTLRDHVKQMLETMAADLAHPETGYAQAEKSKGRRPVKKNAAATHGTDRLESGFSLISTMAEYRALRASVTRLWQEAHLNKPVTKADEEDLIRFNEALDQAASESVASYSHEKEQQARVFETILSSSPDLSFTLDLAGRFSYVNKALTELLGLSSNSIVGKNCFDLDFSTATELHGHIQHVINAKEHFCGEIPYATRSGEARFYEYILAPVLTKRGKVEAVAGTARNITERKASEDNNWHKANYDLLTGLPNRRLFRDRLEQAVKHAERVVAPFALLFIDLDHFKEANDTLGHEAGDLLLRLVADRIRECVREADTVARLGGDEFTVILQDLINAEHIELIARKILKELVSPFQINNDTIHISASIGIALCPQDAHTSEDIIKMADEAMYGAKNAGRNRFSFFSRNQGQPDGAPSTHHRFLTELRFALPKHQFTLVYQPIFDLATRRIVKAEGLLRWRHPKMGLLFPGQFIEQAEEVGLIQEMHAIGDRVFTEAALRSREWSDLSGMPFQISINLSAMQFAAHPNILKWGTYLKSLGLATHCIAVDIKEEIFLNGASEASSRITELHDAGIEVAVDGFGIGSSSIVYLKKFSVDTIKLDPSLVHEMTSNVSSQTITTARIRMAHILGLKVIAEGVETNDQRDCLQAAGCDYAQGYWFAAPVPADEFEKLLQHASCHAGSESALIQHNGSTVTITPGK